MIRKNKPKGFVCQHCRQFVKFDRQQAGTNFRNHCPGCLWSVHLGQDWPAHSAIVCKGEMEPVGLTFKHEGWNKYGKAKQGELMIIHRCSYCGQVTINRLAADDAPEEVIKVFKKSLQMDEDKKRVIESENIKLLTQKDEKEITKQLFGKIE